MISWLVVLIIFRLIEYQNRLLPMYSKSSEDIKWHTTEWRSLLTDDRPVGPSRTGSSCSVNQSFRPVCELDQSIHWKQVTQRRIWSQTLTASLMENDGRWDVFISNHFRFSFLLKDLEYSTSSMVGFYDAFMVFLHLFWSLKALVDIHWNCM